MKAREVFAIIVASVFGMAAVASAADFEVSPFQVNLSPGAPTSLVSLSNTGDKPKAFQLSAFLWKQADREPMRLVPTEDVIVSQSIVQLAPGEARDVLLSAATTFGVTEKTYRLAVQELSNVDEPTRMTIPVFLQPSRQVMVASVHGTRDDHGRFSLDVENQGATHFVVDKIVVHGIAQDGESLFDRELRGGYVLAGRLQTYDLLVPEAGCAQMAAIALEVRIGKNVLRDTIEIPSSMCGR